MTGFRLAITSLAIAGATGISLAAGVNVATAETGYAVPWQLGFQEAASPLMREIAWFHDQFLMPIAVIISVFVAGLLGYCIYRFNEKANPVPSKTTHHTLLEVVWTVVPVLILVAIAIPSFRLLYKEQSFPPADVTIKAIGNQWYWSYAFPENGDFEFDSLMVKEEDLAPGQLRLLTVDNELVVPVGKVVHILVTARPTDVMHNWALPAFGIKVDAIPGRLNQAWFVAEKEGVYYGQCSELCGQDHAFMPIMVRVVSPAEYDKWLADTQEKYAGVPANRPVLARAQTDKEKLESNAGMDVALVERQ